ncbi:hypothetical protein NL108_009370, partial [Boleophthalmus pectinirostris]
ACISSYWDTSKTTSRASKMYQCPLCKESFNRRPELHINRTLKEITEHFKQAAATGTPVSGEARSWDNRSPISTRRKSTPNRRGEMPEGVITEMVTRFQKTITEHDDPPPAYTPQRSILFPCFVYPGRYTVSSAHDQDPSLPLCPLHLRGLAYFCPEDNVCVCSACAESSDHRGHTITNAKREWQIRKSRLGIVDVELKDLISERETKVLEIQTTLLEIKAAAEKDTGEAVNMFLKLIANVERCQAEILEVIEISRRAAEHKAQKLLKELEEELSELKKRRATLTQLAQTDNYIQLLTTFSSLSALPQTKDWSSAAVGSELPSGVILRNITQTMERFKEEMCRLTEVCTLIIIVLLYLTFKPSSMSPPEDITLDPNTSHPRLVISLDGKQVFCGDKHQIVPDSPERFDRVVCALAREGFDCGRHYWE